MADMAELGLVADSSGLVPAVADLKEFREEAKAVDEAVGEMVETVDEIESSMEAANAAAEEAADAFEASASEVSDFTNALHETEEALEDTADEMEDVAKATDELADSLENASKEFKKVIDDLKFEYDQIGRTAKEKRAMNEIRKAGVDASSAEAKAIRDAVDAIDKETKAVERNEAVKKRATTIAKAFAVAATAAIVAGIGDSVARLEKERTSLDRYSQALRTMGSDTTFTANRFKNLADEIELATGRMSQEILDLGANAASFGFADEVFERSIKLANDMAAAWGGDLKMNFEGLARALDDPIAGFAMLRQRGISLTETQADMVKKLIDTNRELDAQRYVMEVLEKQVKGVAEAGFTGLTAAWARTTKSSQLFFDAIVQGTGIMRGLEVALNGTSALIRLMTENLSASIPVMVAAGVALAAIFGPTVIAGIQTVSLWIGTQLVKSVLAFNAALLANPLAIFLAALVGVLAYMVDWEVAIRNLIQAWALFMYHWKSFWGDTEGANHYIEIGLNADKAVEQLKQSAADLRNALDIGASNVGNSTEEGGRRAGDHMKGAIERGGAGIAGLIERGVANAAVTTQALITDAATRAVMAYEQANSIASEQMAEMIVTSHQTGAEYIYNRVTGAVKKVADTSANAIANSGSQAAGAMQSAISSGGADAAASFEAAGVRLSGWLVSYFVDKLDYLMTTQIRLISAQTNLLNQQAYALSMGRSNGGGSNYGSGSSGGERRTYTSGSIGSGMGGNNTYPFPNWVDRDQPATGTTNVTVQNIVDPSMALDALDTARGADLFVNIIKAKREEILPILGSR